ncbi:MAG: ribonuclease E/G, partial [Proteobacteria bacterium]|nr:ribonuclease E/G [Pseudomonadota bacterium]
WDQIRGLTLKSKAPAMIYEEGNLVKRAIRDLYKRDIDEVHVAGREAFNTAKEFMTTLIPSHVKKLRLYHDETVPLFSRYKVEKQIEEIYSTTVHLKSGGYIVINPTEALVSIDVNSGKATKGRHIEETALKTNLESADEIARQLRLRDQGGLVVIDFIDMEENKNNRIVERRVKEAMQGDRARIQLGRISPFGLMELSRQRLNPSIVETSFETCAHCEGRGVVRTTEAASIIILRGIEEEASNHKVAEVKVKLSTDVALYIFNNKRDALHKIEEKYNVKIELIADDCVLKPNYEISTVMAPRKGRAKNAPPQPIQTVDMSDFVIDESDITEEEDAAVNNIEEVEDKANQRPTRRRGKRGGKNRGRYRKNNNRNKNKDGNGDDKSKPEAKDTKKPASKKPAPKKAEKPAAKAEPATQRKGWWKRLTE